MTPPDSSSDPAPAKSGLSDDHVLAMLKGALSQGNADDSKSAAWEPPTPETLSLLLPNYEFQKILGQGGMGAVYLARHKPLDRMVAIKVLPSDIDDNDMGFAERFQNEARAMAKLSHPGIVAVYDFGETPDGLLYIVMEYIEGTDVARMVARQGRLRSAHAMAIVAHVCDALHYAHSRGIIHRDIKPSNIMISNEGIVKVADFGLAKMSHPGQTMSITQSGMVMGTPHFMAPESLTPGGPVDQRADIYAVGVMLYQMLTGKLPQGLFEMPSFQVPGLDPRYDTIVAKALREDLKLRYQQASELRHDLDALMTQPVVKVEPEQPQIAIPPIQAPSPIAPVAANVVQAKPDAEPPTPGRRYRGWLLAAAAVFIAAAGGVLLLGNIDKSVLLATKEKPFTNSIGMKFVPVPGTTVLFCIHETRRQDYAAFAKEVPDVPNAWNENSRDGLPVTKVDDHPVVNVNYDDAKAFCAWLSKKEGLTYRLPTDREWSMAVGIGELEPANETPENLRQKIANQYPWGTTWPPPDHSGNFADACSKDRTTLSSIIEGYNDGYDSTSPVMAFTANKLGIYDLAGNVWQWCEDTMSPTNTDRVRRGSSWIKADAMDLLSSHRPGYGGWLRDGYTGFRCVLELPKP